MKVKRSRFRSWVREIKAETAGCVSLLIGRKDTDLVVAGESDHLNDEIQELYQHHRHVFRRTEDGVRSHRRRMGELRMACAICGRSCLVIKSISRQHLLIAESMGLHGLGTLLGTKDPDGGI